MSRLSGDNATEAQAAANRWCWLIDLAFPSGTLRYTTGPLAYVVSSNTYTRAPVTISGVNERADGKPGQVTIGLPFTSAIRTALADNYQNRKVTVYLAFYNADYSLVTGSPVELASYFMSNTTRSLGETANVSLMCEPVISRIFRANPVMPSNTDQQARYASDNVFARTAAIDGYEFEWGGRTFTNRTVHEGSGRGGNRPLVPLPGRDIFSPNFDSS